MLDVGAEDVGPTAEVAQDSVHVMGQGLTQNHKRKPNLGYGLFHVFFSTK